MNLSPVVKAEALGSFSRGMRMPSVNIQCIGTFRRIGLAQSLGGEEVEHLMIGSC